MSRPPAPAVELSTVVVTPAGFEAIRPTVAALAAQARPERIELVIVAPRAHPDLRPDRGELRRFGRVDVVIAGDFASTGSAIARGVERATGPVVAYAEEHVYPEPGWAEAIVTAHRGPWAAVGAALENANPGTSVSWASMCTDFGRWLGHDRPLELDRLPPHQTTYKRALLAPYGRRLAHLLEVESTLQADLIARGHRLLFEPAAVVRHVNPSVLRSYVRAELLGGRLFAAARADSEAWSTRRRALYVAAAPLIPLVRLRRSLTDVRRVRGRAWPTARVVPALLVGLVAHTVGECLGYSRGSGDSGLRRTSIELHRHRHLRDDETG